MPHRIRLQHQALKEYRVARRHYLNEGEPLEERFRLSVESALNRIAADP